MQTYHTLLLLTHTHEDDVCRSYATIGQVLSLHLHLVGWNDRHTTPSDDFCAEEVDSHRRHTTPCAFTLESSDGTRISDEECRLLPYE